MAAPTKSLYSPKNIVAYTGLGLIAVAIGFVVAWFWADNMEHRFEQDGVKTKAAVVRHDSDFNIHTFVTTYSLYYQYVSDGNVVHVNKEEGVPYDIWPDGTLIDIIYLKSQPDNSFVTVLPHFKVEKDNAVGVGLCSFIAGVTCLTVSYFRSIRRKKLLLIGIETLATAHTLEKVPNREPHLLYQFRTDDNKSIEGYFDLSKSSQKLWEKRLLTHDVNFRVVYNPLNPSEHTILNMPSRLS